MGNSIFCSACEPICCEPINVLTPRHYLVDAQKQKLLEEYEEYLVSKKGRRQSKDIDPTMFKWHVKGVERVNTDISKLHMSMTPTSALIDSDNRLNNSFNLEDQGVKGLKLIEC
mmetsp:Transcript_62383/g.56248  ORF Transcript_62383/g.56248 Transcript_62383/m.56248 type:complete len:114 (-) Transcript_62383:176-517(-)